MNYRNFYKSKLKGRLNSLLLFFWSKMIINFKWLIIYYIWKTRRNYRMDKELLKKGRYNHLTTEGDIATFHLETDADMVLDSSTKRVITKKEGEDWNAKSAEVTKARSTYPTLNDRINDFYIKKETDGKYALLSEVVAARTGQKDLLTKFETYWTKAEADERFNFKHAEADYTYGKEELNSFFKGINDNFVKNVNFKWGQLQEKPTNLETTEGAKKKADDALAAANNHSDSNLTTSKSYSDTKLTEAKQYADTNLNTAKSYSDTKIAQLVNSAPGTLDTLKELADALGGDPNFATTVATNIGKKADKTYVDTELGKKLNKGDNAVSATKLLTPRKINGVNFDGTADITTSIWGRTAAITIGNSKKSVNGADIGWSLSEIGAAESGHSHSYLPLAGGSLTGVVNSSVSSSTYLNANKGTAIINSTANGTGFNMLASMSSTNGRWLLGSYGTNFQLFYTSKSSIDASTNSPTKTLTLINESGDSSFPGILSASELRATTSRATPITLTRTDSSTNINLGFNGNGVIKYLGCPNGVLKFGDSEDLNTNGNVVYHAGNKPTPADLGAAAISGGHKIFCQSGTPTATTVGDIWIKF